MRHQTVLRWSCVALIVGAVAAALLGSRAHAAADPPEQDVQTLKRRLAAEVEMNAKLRLGNEALQRRLTELGAQLTKLEDQLKDHAAKITLPPMLPPPQPGPQRLMPPGSDERQFNGAPYYVIPLNSNGAGTQSTSSREAMG